MALPQLLGDAAMSPLDQEIDGFLLKAGPSPMIDSVTDFLKLYPANRRMEVSRALVARGISPAIVNAALGFVGASSVAGSSWYWILSTASAALSGYHGYKRNNSLGWGIGWFFLGGLLPVITPTIALAQGFGKRKVG